MTEYKRKEHIIVDISKIINDSLDKSVKDVADGKFKSPDISNSESKQDQMLINYSNILLRTYHEELCKELAKHGIGL